MIAYITGGSKGIGYGIAEAVLSAGGKVAITARTLASAETAAKNLAEKYNSDDILPLASSVSELDSEQSAVAETIKKFCKIDLVVANAGIGKFGSIEDLSPEDWQTTIDTNLTGVFNTVKATLDPLKISKGFLITISSLAGTNFFAGGAAYNASKFGLTGFTMLTTISPISSI